MRHIFGTPRWKDSIAYSIVLDGAGADTIVAEALGSRRFEVIVRGPGGHSWSDFGAPNPIVILARTIESFCQTPVPATPKSTFNIGVIRGGTSVNSIPESASMDQAITAYTQGSAFAEFGEKDKGQLVPGKLADFVVLDRDITAVSSQKLLETQVLRTVVGGKTVYEAK